MPILHDFKCAKCKRVFERRVAWDTEEARCDCGAQATRVFISHRAYRAQSFDPVLVYRDKSGHYRFPGRNAGVTPKGYEPVYLRTTSEVRKFERTMSQHERDRYFRHKERAEAAFAPWIANARSELRQRMQSMSAYGRSLAEAAIRASDSQSSVDTRFDPGCHFNAFAFDASNREPQGDRDLPRRK